MLRAFVLVFVLGACGRVGFTALVDGHAPTGDAAGPAGDAGGSPDAPASGSALLVQAVAVSSSTQSFTIGAAAGLAPITAGDMVLVMCGAPLAGGPCTPTSLPNATWTSLDLGSNLSAFVTCGAPAITSISIDLGAAEPATTIVTEWRGLSSAACVDQGKTSIPCGTSSWSVSMTSNTLQNKELLVAIGMANNDTTAWTIDTPYTMAKQDIGPGGNTAVFVADALADPTPALPTVSGTVGAWTVVCWNDLFAFEAVQ